jgi:molybdate transport system ATP-binding protein
MTLTIRLRHAFAGFTLDVDITTGPGVTALFGRSGSGKTTIVNAVAGLLRPDEGTIHLDGDTLLDTATNRFLPPHRRRMGYVFQDSRLFPHLTVRQNLTYARRFTRSATLPFDQVTDLLGLAPLLDRRPATLSGGERQRTAIGRALLSAPQLLLMDEPLASLDDRRKAEILPYLERLRDETRLPILYVSHAMPEVARLADHLVLIDAGRVTAQGPTAALLSDPATAPALGLREAGSLLTARIAGHDADGLTRLDTATGPLWLPRLTAPPGTDVRLRILAQDVMIATTRPTGISALNILPATITDIRPGEGPGTLVRLALGPDAILARITRRSADTLALHPGQQVYAVLKAVSVAQENVTPAAPAPTGG